jgi:acyl dehydratase
VTTFATLDDLAAAVGADLGTTDWYLVDQQRIDAFADATEDHQWIHVDVERAKAGPFGTTVAHGFLTLSLAAPALVTLVAVEQASGALNYGLDKVRFPAAVPAGTRVRAHATLAAVEPVAGGAQATVRVTMEAEGVDRPVCVADCLLRVFR